MKLWHFLILGLKLIFFFYDVDVKILCQDIHDTLTIPTHLLIKNSQYQIIKTIPDSLGCEIKTKLINHFDLN